MVGLGRSSVVGRRLTALGTLALSFLLITVTAVGSDASPAPSSPRSAVLVDTGSVAIDGGDLFAFVSPDDRSKVTLIASWPRGPVAASPDFSPRAVYRVHVDNDGDAKADLVFSWHFENRFADRDSPMYISGRVTGLDDEDLNFLQTYDLTLRGHGGHERTLVRDGVVAPANVGETTMPDYEGLREEAVERAGDGRFFAGPADVPFFADLSIFDRLMGEETSPTEGHDALAGSNVNAIALELPKKTLARAHNASRHPVIAVWASAAVHAKAVLGRNGSQRLRDAWVQISRLGMPLVTKVFIPLEAGARWNGTPPASDEKYSKYYDDPDIARVIERSYGDPLPDSDARTPGVNRADLRQVFLTGIPGLNKAPGKVALSDALRLNMSVPLCSPPSCDRYSRLGVVGGDFAGFPNGRRLGDDVLDVTLQLLAGELLDNPNDLSDNVEGNDVPFEQRFPYLGLPHADP